MNEEEKLDKQRLNLIISSLVLIIYEIAGLKFKTINILGNEISVQNEHAIPVLIFLFWAYSLFRFYQYSRTNSKTGHQKVKTDFLELMDRYSQEIIDHKAHKKVIEKKDIDSLDDLNIKTGSFSTLNKESLFEYSYQSSFYKPVYDSDEFIVETQYSLSEFSRPIWKTLTTLIIRTPTITEYVLPYLLAIAALLVLFYTYSVLLYNILIA